MREFMLLTKNIGDKKAYLTHASQLSFIHQCEIYITDLKKKGQLIAAQPLFPDGLLLSKRSDSWQYEIINKETTLLVGYYHILAKDMEEAIRIAKNNPEFEYIASTSIEIREVKVKESLTEFIYPK